MVVNRSQSEKLEQQRDEEKTMEGPKSSELKKDARTENSSMAGEDPHKHFMELHVVCTSMKTAGVTKEQIQLRAFPFHLKDAAKDLLYYLPPVSITTWNEMKRIFLEKYFPASRATNIRKEIYDIKQYMGETLHEYWKHFKNLCSSCLQHQISENLLIQYCFEGFLHHDRIMVDAASGGVFSFDKTPQGARNLIANMAPNSQQFGTSRLDLSPKKKNEVNVSSLEQQLIDLKSLVRQIVVENGKNVKVCEICTAKGHSTDMCTTLQEESIEKVNATEGFPGPPQRNYDPYLNKYNPGWKDHPNLIYDNTTMNQPAPHVQPNNQPFGPPYPPKPQAPQITTPVSNPKENVSAITLRNGRELNTQEKESKVDENESSQKDTPKGKFPPLSEYKPIPPFPFALKESKKDESIKDFYDTFCRCERKIPAKCKNSGMFSIPCTTGNVQLEKAILDLGASINLMSYPIYASLKLIPLKETVIVIQMANRSTIYPKGVIEDVLVKVDNLASKTVLKFPPDRQKKNIPMEKGRSHQEMGISKKSKKNKHRPKLTVKILKWVKVDKVTKYEPP
ncbi:uncharacterized protein [Henckelia pumila]|uniref:uncharacterized protein n=1 Tax=Henckelia pumila TaxID=405737 RepID=UPI003C6E1170